MKSDTNIICPNCKRALSRSGAAWKCQDNHCFDVSKEGYLNLLLANQKKSKSPGDSKKMINARENFLGTGAFDFLITRLREEIEDLYPALAIDKHQEKHLGLDLGCGSGFYLRNILDENRFRRIGIDISKEATSIAAKSDKTGLYLVSSVFNIPIQDHSIAAVLNIFAPIDLAEIHRILKPFGYLIKVIPDKGHMKEIAEMIYENVTEHSSNFEKDIEDYKGLEVIKEFSLHAKVKANADNLLDFIAMTPYFYKFQAEQLQTLEETEVSLGFVVYIVRSK